LKKLKKIYFFFFPLAGFFFAVIRYLLADFYLGPI